MQTEIAILMSCISRLDNEGMFKPHHHPYYQLNHILKGAFTFAVDGETFTAHPGDTVLIPYNRVHSLKLDSALDGYYYEIKFTTFSKRDRDMCREILVFSPKDSFTGELMAVIREENENMVPGSDEIMVNYLYSILYKLSSEKRRQQNVPSKFIEMTAYSESVRDTIRYLEDNYMRQPSLEDIVAHTHVQKSSLCRRFKDETSLTIFECLMIIRIRKAVELLTYTSRPLMQISKDTGFVSLTHFNRVFTKHVMVPPGHYRKHLQQQNLYLSNAVNDPRLPSIAQSALSGKKIDFQRV